MNSLTQIEKGSVQALDWSQAATSAACRTALPRPLHEFYEVALVKFWLANRFLKLHCIAPVVRTSTAFASCKTPSHRISRFQQSTDRAVRQSRCLESETMKPKVGALHLDRHEHIQDQARRAIALTDGADPHPHALLQSLSVLPDMAHVFVGRVTLQNGHDVHASVAMEKPVVSLYSEPLMVGYRKASLFEHDGFAHIVLRDSRQQVAVVLPAFDLSCVFFDRMRIAAIGADSGKRLRIHDPIAHCEWPFATAQPTHRHECSVKMLRVGRLV